MVIKRGFSSGTIEMYDNRVLNACMSVLTYVDIHAVCITVLNNECSQIEKCIKQKILKYFCIPKAIHEL